MVDYEDWNRKDVAGFARRKRIALRLIGAYDQALNPMNARGLIVWSEEARRLHRAHGAPPSFLRVIPPHVSPAPVIDPTLAAPDAPPRYLFVGADWRRKNGTLVVTAFRRIQPSLPPGATLTMVGETDEPITGAGIVHHSRLPRETILRDLYTHSNIFVLPSRAEGYGVAAIEAMSAGLAPVVSTTGVLPEIVGDAGIAVDVTGDDASRLNSLAAAMLRLGTDPTYRAILGTRARERYAAVWSREATGRLLAAAYHRAIAGGIFAE